MAQIKTEPLTDYYDVKEELGRGRFAVVKRCVKISSGEIFAAKCIRKARGGRRGREQLLLEIDILHNSDHPKLVKLYDVFETRSEMILILEYAAGGDLHKHCLEVEAVRTEKEICSLVYQIVEAASYLHDNHVVHLDLKPENILLKNDEKFPEIRLIDFGLSRRVDLPYSQYDIVGTPEYVAPEVLSYEAIKISADMWSIGVVSYVLLSGISPFAGDDVMETYANIANVDFDFDAEEFDDISDEAKDFIESLLIKDPTERLTTKECLEHPWLKQMAGGVQREDIEAALIAEEAFEKLIREESISRMENEGSVFSSETDTQEEGEQAISSDDSSEDDVGEIKENEVLVENPGSGINETELSTRAEYETDFTVKDQENKVNEEVPQREAACELERGSQDQYQTAEILEKPGRGGILGKECDESNSQESRGVEIEKEESSSKETTTSHSGFGFDIDSLICKDEEGASVLENVEKENEDSLILENDINSNVALIAKPEIVNELNIDSNFHRTANDNTEINKSEIAVEERPESGVGKEAENQHDSKTESLEVGVSYNKQISADVVLASRSMPTSVNGKGTDGKVVLGKSKSVDEFLMSGKKKTNETPKGSKLGACFEKLTKAGLNIVEDVDRKRYTDFGRSYHGSIKRTDSNGSKENLLRETSISSTSSGSSTPTSVSVNPDLTSLCFTNENKQQAKSANGITPKMTESERTVKDNAIKSDEEKSTGVDTVKNGKTSTPVLARKISTPSSEKSAYPKKQPLGVPQGIAAQMASKFSSNVDRFNSPSPSKLNKSPGQSLISNRKYWEAGTAEAKRNDALKSKHGSLNVDKTLFKNALKVAQGESSQDQTLELERKTRSPKTSPKLNRWKNNAQVKGRAEQSIKPSTGLIKPATDSDKTKVATESERIKPATDSDKTKVATESERIKPATDSDKTKVATDSERIKPATDSDKTKVATDSERIKPATDSDKSKAATESDKTKIATDSDKTKAATDSERIKPATESDITKAKGFNPRVEKKPLRASNRFDHEEVSEKNVKKTSTKENILQKFEKQNKDELNDAMNQVTIQRKGLQFSFNLQACNKFKMKEVERGIAETNAKKALPNAAHESKKTVTFDAAKEAPFSKRRIEPVTIPKSFSGILEDDDTFETQGNNHIEHTAIGAIATMPRTPLRELRSKSRTSRDGGSPSSPRKAYRRLYVTHVKGSKSEMESEAADDIADVKTKMDKDELKVELLVKFGTL